MGAAVLAVGVILVLLILRGTIGDESTPVAETNDDPSVEPAVQPSPTPLTTDEVLAGRLELPLAVPEGYEALAVRASFVRGVAGVPIPGDRVNLYRMPAIEVDEVDEVAANDGDTVTSVDELPPVGPDAELVLADVEILGLTGAVPSANGGDVTFLLAIDPLDVSSLMAVANRDELWATLLPAPDDDGTRGDA